MKDILLYPFVWRAYDTRFQQEHNFIIGLSGMANDRLDPEGYIIVKGEYWRARIVKDSKVIEKGERVKISGINGLTLIVEAEQTASN
jgi:membrane-bound serine protease (ClpP class)